MDSKFLKLVENTITRYSNGGILTGDQVELSNKCKSVPDYKNLPDDVKQQIEELFASDDTVIVVNIQTKMPSTAPGNADNRGTEFVATVARMIDSGRYDNQNKVSLPLNCLKKLIMVSTEIPYLTQLNMITRFKLTLSKQKKTKSSSKQ